MAGGPESPGFQPFLPRFSHKSRPTSDSGRLRPSDCRRLRLRSSSGVVSSDLLHCCLPTPFVRLSPQLVVSFACTRLLPQDRRRLAHVDGPAPTRLSCLRLVALRQYCAWPPIGAGSRPLVFTLLLSPSPVPLFRSPAPLPFVCRILPPLSLMRWRPTIACSGARAARVRPLPLTPSRAPADA